MILVAGGDSFVYGSELQDHVVSKHPSNSSFTALLANNANLEYQCVAWPGNSNSGITRMTMLACEQLLAKHRQPVVVVSWTFANRYEFRFNYNTRHRNSPWYSITPWNIKDFNNINTEVITPNDHSMHHQVQHNAVAAITGVADFAKTFYMHIGDNEYYELYNSFKEFLLLQNYLTNKNIPYLFTVAEIGRAHV